MTGDSTPEITGTGTPGEKVVVVADVDLDGTGIAETTVGFVDS